jgi:hypothetical protein
MMIARVTRVLDGALCFLNEFNALRHHSMSFIDNSEKVDGK